MATIDSGRREFLMLAHKFKTKHFIGGAFLSEKLDGMRAFWDGGISRGVVKSLVPWANTSKDGRFKNVQVATGLWSRYGNVIHAPGWWLDQMPALPVDGELYIGGLRQRLMSIVKKNVPGEGWENVRLNVFDAPSFAQVFASGLIKGVSFTKSIDLVACAAFIKDHDDGSIERHGKRFFKDTVTFLEETIDPKNKHCKVHLQIQLPGDNAAARARMYHHLETITNVGGEGVILRLPYSFWTPKRVYTLLKVKPLHDAEGTVMGYISGRETDKGSKLRGMMGALILDFEGKRLELSGFTEAERMLTDSEYAWNHPGFQVPDNVSSVHFPRGSQVTFKYRALTKAGIPEEARYWRKHS